jgi:hypothetical protein
VLRAGTTASPRGNVADLRPASSPNPAVTISPMRHTGSMFALVLGMLVCLVGGMVVMGFVAAQARRDGRELLTQRGEEVVGKVSTRR